MRIILKPAGALLILVAFGSLVFLLLHKNGGASGAPSTRADAAGAPAPNSSASPPPPLLATLQNTGFETDYQPSKPYDTKAQLSGAAASPWHDDSSWARVTVAYAQDDGQPHSGATCQRIDVREVHREIDPTSVVQFVQEVRLNPGKAYDAGLWLRADRATPIEISLREAKWPFKYYAAKTYTIGPNWSEAKVGGTIGSDGDTFLLLKIWQPATVWVDDATLGPRS